jgi:hypothetical protein
MFKLDYSIIHVSLVWFNLVAAISSTLSAQSPVYRPTNGPQGGEIYHVVNEQGTCHISTANGFYSSHDSGENWVLAKNGLPQFYYASDFAVDHDELFLFCGDHASFFVDYFFYSSDGGKNWSRIQTPLPSGNISNFSYKKGVLLVIQDKKLYESKDKGANWNEINLPAENFYTHLIKANNDYFFISTSNQIYRRPINENNWTLVYSFPGNFTDFHLSDDKLIVLRDGKSGFTSLDQGNSWSEVNVKGSANYYSIADFGDSLFYLVDNKLMISTDKGLNWNVRFSLPYGNYYGEVYRIGNKIALDQYNTGLFYSEDSFKTVRALNKNVFALSSLTMAENSDYIFSSNNFTISRFDKNLKIWEDGYSLYSQSPISNVLCFDSLVIVKPSGNLLFLSSDNGRSFHEKSIQNLWLSPTGYRIKGVKKGSNILIQNEDNFYSEDNGASWEKFNLIYDGLPCIILSLAEFENQALALVKMPGLEQYLILSSKDLVNWSIFHDFRKTNFLYNTSYELISDKKNLFILKSDNSPTLIKFSLDKREWKLVQRFPNFTFPSYPFSITLIELPNGNLLLNLPNGLWFSDDEGDHWSLYIDEFYRIESNLKTDMILFEDSLYISNKNIGVIKRNTNFDESKYRGLVFYDLNKNKQFDSIDIPLKGSYLRLNKAGYPIHTNSEGKFNIFISATSSDSLVTAHKFKHGQFVPERRLLSQMGQNLEFAYQIEDNINDCGISCSEFPRARPGFKYYLSLIVTNHGGTWWSGTVGLHYDPVFELLSCDLNFQSKNNNKIVWLLDSLAPLTQRKITIEFILDRSVPVGTKIFHEAWVKNDSITDTDLLDNRFLINSEVVASCDPNEIVVDRNWLSLSELDSQPELEYTVRFQNTGNYPAEFVDIKIPLFYFHSDSVKIIASSHPYHYYTVQNKSFLMFHFDMINLPDSASNEKNSHGFIKFKLIPRKDRISNNVIHNYADIIFDYNQALRTDTTKTYVGSINAIDDENLEPSPKISIFPNPGLDFCTILLGPEPLPQDAILQVSDLLGNICIHQSIKLHDSKIYLDISHLNPGVYLVYIKNSHLTPGQLLKY